MVPSAFGLCYMDIGLTTEVFRVKEVIRIAVGDFVWRSLLFVALFMPTNAQIGCAVYRASPNQIALDYELEYS